MANGSPNWVVMVYISADGVLANFAVESLKQLKRAAGPGVIVKAQVDRNGPLQGKRYIFDGSDINSSLRDSNWEPLGLPPGDGTPNPKNLTDFIDWATRDSIKPDSDIHYALFLWGHGVELLLDDDPPEESLLKWVIDKEGTDASQEPVRRYLTPARLKDALEGTRLVKDQHEKLDILGLDACSMAFLEIASELSGCVDFMIASQQDIPDLSFPYGNILLRLQDEECASVEAAAKMIPSAYKNAYSDYVADPRTGVTGISLSSLRLQQDKIDRIIECLNKLATSLLAARFDADMRKRILSARKTSQSFVFGLFVDLSDFCKHLETQLEDSSYGAKVDINNACTNLRQALQEQNGEFVFDNQNVVNNLGNGLSIYLPYTSYNETEQFQEFRVKGTRALPLKGTRALPLKERSARIAELEQDFADLRLGKTEWSEFVKSGWSFILATEELGKLDQHYSAQQCAKNLADSKRPLDSGRSLERSDLRFEKPATVVPISDPPQEVPA
jgi:hypothetical protein